MKETYTITYKDTNSYNPNWYLALMNTGGRQAKAIHKLDDWTLYLITDKIKSEELQLETNVKKYIDQHVPNFPKVEDFKIINPRGLEVQTVYSSQQFPF